MQLFFFIIFSPDAISFEADPVKWEKLYIIIIEFSKIDFIE